MVDSTPSPDRIIGGSAIETSSQTGPLILGSASPRRSALLRELGVDHEIIRSDVEELAFDMDPAKTARYNARLKFDEVNRLYPRRAILTADTVINHHGGLILKPVDMEQAIELLLAFSGHAHQVITSFALGTGTGSIHEETVSSEVHFKSIDLDHIKRYFSTVNPLDKAGGYDIGDHGNLIIERHQGSFSNIMGLPKHNVKLALKQQGII